MQEYFDKILEGVLKRPRAYALSCAQLESSLFDKLVTEVIIELKLPWEEAVKTTLKSFRKVLYKRWGEPLSCFAFNEREWSSIEEFATVIVEDIQNTRKLLFNKVDVDLSALDKKASEV